MRYRFKIKVLFSLISNYFSNNELYYIIENANWSIQHDGRMITDNLKKKSITSLTHFGIKNAIIHYGSIGTFISKNKIKIPHKSNKIIVTWFHVVPNNIRIKLISEAINYVDLWHTSCHNTKCKMINMGIPEEKIVVIPLGVDTKVFKIKKSCRIDSVNSLPKNTIVIGSFQKDGNGWGVGGEPKLIKGPDVFCDVVELLSKRYDIFVLLTGPSRGYVKKRLEDANISYKHDLLADVNSLVDYYNAIDLYIITSREEGGPKALLESFACGVPLVSTKVGMSLDIVINNENGYLVDIEDVDSLYISVCKVIDNKKISDKFSVNG